MATKTKNQLIEQEKAYIAGFFDGEGCVEISRNHHRANPQLFLRIIVSNTYKPIIDWLYAIYGGTTHFRKQQANWRSCWHWRISARKAEIFLRDIYPYSKIKKEQIKLAFEFIETIKSKGRNNLTQEVKTKREQLKSQISGFKYFDYGGIN